jgi:membrane fusion protein, multidrug efflux system
MQQNHSYKRGSFILIALVIALGLGLGLWKRAALQASASAVQPEMPEMVEATTAQPRQHQPSTTSIGTVVALRSIVLRNELPGTVHEVALQPGAVVEAGTVLVTLDTSVERAELTAQRAEAELAESRLNRTRQLVTHGAISVEELDTASAQQLVMRAQIARTEAIIARKTLRAPFRARVGIADVHPGQYLEQGTQLTTLQGVADAVYIDFAVAQQVAAGLRIGDSVQIESEQRAGARQVEARIVAIDARVDAKSRNTTIRARTDAAAVVSPGASVRVRTASAPAQSALAVPTSALRRSPGGDHVFVLAKDAEGNLRAQLRRVQAGPALGDEVLIEHGLEAGERIATAGSFKLRDTALVAIAASTAAAPPAANQTAH